MDSNFCLVLLNEDFSEKPAILSFCDYKEKKIPKNRKSWCKTYQIVRICHFFTNLRMSTRKKGWKWILYFGIVFQILKRASLSLNQLQLTSVASVQSFPSQKFLKTLEDTLASKKMFCSTLVSCNWLKLELTRFRVWKTISKIKNPFSAFFSRRHS